MTAKLLKISQRLIKWDTDFPVNSHNGYAGLKELDAIIADAKVAVHEAGASYEDDFGQNPSPSPNVEGDNQPRYTTKRLHDEIAKAKALARIEILDQLHSKALAQVEYFDRKQREFICLEDCHDEDGELHLPDSIEPLLRHDHANGRMSEAAWWRDTIQQLKEEGDPARQTKAQPYFSPGTIASDESTKPFIATGGGFQINPAAIARPTQPRLVGAKITAKQLREKADFAEELGYRDHANTLRDAADTIEAVEVQP